MEGGNGREIDNIESKDTWEETVLPPGRKAIDSRWVFAIEYVADGKIIKYKARLVAKGFYNSQMLTTKDLGLIGRLTGLRILLTLAAIFDLKLHQAHVKGAYYLNGRLDTEMCMRCPDSVVRLSAYNALRLKGSLYGLKQSGRVWWLEPGSSRGTGVSSA